VAEEVEVIVSIKCFDMAKALGNLGGNERIFLKDRRSRLQRVCQYIKEPRLHPKANGSHEGV
jgi:hypothetical protein